MELMNFAAAAPEMTLLGLICIVLVADLFVDKERRVLTFWMSLASIAVTTTTTALALHGIGGRLRPSMPMAFLAAPGMAAKMLSSMRDMALRKGRAEALKSSGVSSSVRS